MPVVLRSAHEIAGDINAGRTTAVRVTAVALEHIRQGDTSINAFTDVTAARASVEAAKADSADVKGSLSGVPFAVKNLFDVAGLATRAGSKINRERVPAIKDSVLIERLNASGAVLLGALNMGEYAYDFTGENIHDGVCRNPHDPERMAGGSSSGSGAAVAAGFVPIALGSDTNGSIRVPSSLCGTFGLKPTYGRLPRTGSFPFCDSLDHLGPMARNTRDLALAYDAMQGFDAGDHACAFRPAEPTLPELDKGTAGLRIAVAGGYFDTTGLPEADEALVRAARALGVSKRAAIDGAEQARAAAFLITNAESAALHLARLRARADDFDPDTRDRFLAGAMLPAAWLIRAQLVRRWFAEQMAVLFQDIDVLIAPATPCVAPFIGQKTMTLRGQDMAVRPNLGLFTQPISCIGLPVIAAPLWPGTSHLPIAIQIIAAPWREDYCLRVAAYLESKGIARSQRR